MPARVHARRDACAGAPCELPAVLLERRTQSTRRFGRRALERPDVAFEERYDAQSRRRDDGGGATTRRQNGDLADNIARPRDPDRRPIDRDLRRAVLDQEERVAEVALAHHRVTGRELALGRCVRDGVELLLGEPGQGSDGGAPASIHAPTIPGRSDPFERRTGHAARAGAS